MLSRARRRPGCQSDVEADQMDPAVERHLPAEAATSSVPSLLSADQIARWAGLPLSWVETPAGAWRGNFEAPVTSIAVLDTGRLSTRVQWLGKTSDADFGPGAMALFHAGTEVKVAQAGCRDARRIILELDPSHLADAFALDGGLGQPPLLQQGAEFRDAALFNVLRAMLREILDGCPNGSLYAQSLSLGALLHLRKTRGLKRAGESRERGKFSRTQWVRLHDLIEQGLGSDLSLHALADALQLSKAQFVRLFRNTAGTSPHRYVMQKRVERAMSLLLTSDLALVDIAAEAGFASQSHLNQMVRLFYGITPGDARRQARLG